jgi:hypothetical protein
MESAPAPVPFIAALPNFPIMPGPEFALGGAGGNHLSLVQSSTTRRTTPRKGGGGAHTPHRVNTMIKLFH